LEKRQERGAEEGGGWQWQLYKQGEGEGERGEGEDHAHVHVWLGKCVGVAKGKEEEEEEEDHGLAGAVPAGGWGLLGVQVEVEVVGKQDSLALAACLSLPRHPSGIYCYCMLRPCGPDQAGSWGSGKPN